MRFDCMVKGSDPLSMQVKNKENKRGEDKEMKYE